MPGGARACALEPVRAATRSGRQCARPRAGVAEGNRRARHAAANRASAPACATQQMAHGSRHARPAHRSVVRAALLARLWQMTAADKRIGQAWLAARQAAIGASTCIANASRTTGRELLQPCAHPPNHSSVCKLNTAQIGQSRGRFRRLLWSGANFPKLWSARPTAGDLRHLRQSAALPQSTDFLYFVICLQGRTAQSFRRLLEF